MPAPDTHSKSCPARSDRSTARPRSQAAIVLCLAATTLLAAASVACAFVGPEKSAAFLHSAAGLPLWGVTLGALLCVFLLYPRLLRKPGLLMAHWAALAVMAGGMLGAREAQRFLMQRSGRSNPIEGYLVAGPGQETRRIVDFRDNRLLVRGELPFSLRIERFWTEYYPVPPYRPWRLLGGYLQDANASRPDAWSLRTIPLDVGERTAFPALPSADTAIDVSIVVQAITWEPWDGDSPWPVPVIPVELRRGGKTVYTVLTAPASSPTGRMELAEVFPSTEAWRKAGSPTLFVTRPPPAVRDYLTELTVLDDNQEKVHRTIEVNRPLRYGNYHLYQQDPIGQDFAVVKAVRDPGWPIVLAGLLLGAAGLVLQLLVLPAAAWLLRRRQP